MALLQDLPGILSPRRMTVTKGIFLAVAIEVLQGSQSGMQSRTSLKIRVAGSETKELLFINSHGNASP